MIAYASTPSEKAYLFRYSFTVNDIPAAAREIKIWVPYPAENSHQEVKDISGKNNSRIGFDPDYGNGMIHYVIKSPVAPDLTIERVYRIQRREFINKPRGWPWKNDQRSKIKEPEAGRYRAFDGFVLITDDVQQLADAITKGKLTELDKARAIYDYLFSHMTYDKTEPGWGQGDIARVCRLWKGNCTDFHSLFIALCRASGIPAKFVIGVSISKENRGSPAGYHCWAEFYLKGRGWIPVDISEAWHDKSKYEYYFGALDAGRIEFSHGRGIKLNPLQKGGPLNYFIYPYVEIDGKAFDKVQTSFYYEDTGQKLHTGG